MNTDHPEYYGVAVGRGTTTSAHTLYLSFLGSAAGTGDTTYTPTWATAYAGLAVGRGSSRSGPKPRFMYAGRAAGHGASTSDVRWEMEAQGLAAGHGASTSEVVWDLFVVGNAAGHGTTGSELAWTVDILVLAEGSGTATGSAVLEQVRDGGAGGGGTGGAGSITWSAVYAGIASGSGTVVSAREEVWYVTGDFKWSFSATPQTGWLACDGSYVSQSTYASLYALLGTTFGPTSGSNFKLPDSRGRVYVGGGSGPGLTPRAAGNSGGLEAVILTAAQSGLPAHTHPPGSPATFIMAYHVAGTGFATGSGLVNDITTTTGANATANAASNHENMQPWLCLGYLYIKT